MAKFSRLFFYSTLALAGTAVFSGCQSTAEVSAPTTQHISGLSQSTLDALAAGAFFNYQVISNYSAKCDQVWPCTEGTLTLKLPQNVNNHWQIFFSSVSPLKSLPGQTPLVIEHINGDLHKLTSTQMLVANQAYSISFTTSAPVISNASVFPNVIIRAEGLIPRVIDNTREKVDPATQLAQVQHAGSFAEAAQYQRRADDVVKQQTPQLVYQRNQQRLGKLADPTVMTNESSTRVLPKMLSSQWQPARLTVSHGIQVPQSLLDKHAAAFALLTNNGLMVSANGLPLTMKRRADGNPEGYRLSISKSGISITSSNDTGEFYALMSLVQLWQPQDSSLPIGQAMDRPRYDFRGVHIDVARNFHSKDVILRLIDNMAALKLNKLHLHLADDEGWRLQIPGLPELTELGSQRCFDLNDTQCLQPQLGAGVDTQSSVNGYYSVDDYLAILRYANARHIEVIPAIDMPGHSRAAIKAMELRYQRLMAANQPQQAEQFLLTEFDDQSHYSSIQYYHDNTLNPCIDSTYRFAEYIVDSLKQLHQQGGQPLQRFHLGADETAGAWTASPACQALMQQQGMHEAKELTGYFIARVAEMVTSKGLIPGAWSDGLAHTDKAQLPANVQANIWDTLFSQGHNRAHEFANQGWDTILSLPDVLYFDFPYAADPNEGGYFWGSRETDAYKVFQLMPDNLPAMAAVWTDRMGQPYSSQDSTPLTAQHKVKGIQSQLWSEVVRNDNQAEYMLYPRLLVLAERAWHQAEWEVPYQAGKGYQHTGFDQDWQQRVDQDWQQLSQRLGHYWLPRLAKQNTFFRLPPPGAVQEGNQILANIEIPGLLVEYAIDTGEWQTYQGPVTLPEQPQTVRLRSRLPNQHRSSRDVQLAVH